MSSLLAVFGDDAVASGALAIRTALGTVPGCSPIRVGCDNSAVVAAAGRSHADAGDSRNQSFAMDDSVLVVADASFYHTAPLCRALGLGSAGEIPSAELVRAAYRAYGDSCVEHLEGDYAFVVWDRHAHRMFCARDFTGRRPLYLAHWRHGLVVSSTLDAINALPGFASQLDMATIGADAAGLLFALDDETAYQGIRTLRAGWCATWQPETGLRTTSSWRPIFGKDRQLRFDDAALHLRELLIESVGERLASRGPTAVWMSGGRDSTAVFGAGMASLRRARRGGPLLPVSRSHPVGDSGREDEAIARICSQWNVSPSWVDAASVRLFAGAVERAATRLQPFAQPFEQLTRALAQRARDLGAAVALDGYGGDFLFQLSPIYLADLVARGHPGRAWREWRRMAPGRGREFFDWGIFPLLPRWLARAVGAARGRPLRSPMERAAPPWIDTRFLRDRSVLGRAAARLPALLDGRSHAERETCFYLTHQHFARVNSLMGALAGDHGVEIRSPLLDQRVVRFALTRPRDERNQAGEHKRLLRAAMRGLLPAEVLQHRAVKSGTLATYFARHMRDDGLSLLDAVGPVPALAAAGIALPREFTSAVTRYRAEGAAYSHVEALYCTLQAELWLRMRPESGAPPITLPPQFSVSSRRALA